VCKRQVTAALAGLALLAAAPGEAAPAVPHVLILQSFDRGSLAIDHFTGNFRIELDRLAGEPVNAVQVVVGPTGFVGATEPAIVDYIQAIFSEAIKPDLIVAVAGPATLFARKYRQRLFPDVPLLFAAVDRRFLRDAPLGANETAVETVNDFPGLVDNILGLLPETTQVFVITGAGPNGIVWRRALDSEFARFRDRLTFIWSDQLALSDILRRCAELPPRSAILYVTFGTDRQGGAYADDRVLAALHDAATAPLFAAQSVMLGAGIVGGPLMSIDTLSRNAADAALRLLRGAPPGTVTVPPQSPGELVFDWRELQRWRIPQSRLPAGSTVRYRAPNLWSEYRRTILGAAGVLIVQSLLIVGLLYQRRARRTAEIESRRNLSLAADASRRETMSALAGSMAHELGQPLNSMVLNAEALRTLIAADRATPDIIGEIVSDIQAQGFRAGQIVDRHRAMLRNHSLDKKRLDVHRVIDESLALVAHDMQARQVKATVHLCSAPCVVDGDQVLLQQVLVNLLMNAMDAMAGTPSARRRLTISCDVVAADIEVSVRDNGEGLRPEVIDRLFTPFVTTKSLGLGIGLTMARTILSAHGGTITGRNNPDGGATFTATVPRSDAPGSREDGILQRDGREAEC